MDLQLQAVLSLEPTGPHRGLWRGPRLNRRHHPYDAIAATWGRGWAFRQEVLGSLTVDHEDQACRL